MNDYNDVLFQEHAGSDGALGIIILNRPQVLNSLNHTMIHAMHAKLKQWAIEPHIKAVVIRAVEGRAFCAGGDLRLTFDRAKTNDHAVTEFFRDEYHLNRFIFHFPKPYIALLDGITMGGGVGISIHGSHRVGTERLLFAMPETGIGFFPDVGGTYFLPRLTGHWGYYLGLTGARIKIDDAVMMGITQVKVDSQSLDDVVQAIAETEFKSNANEAVSRVLARYAKPANTGELTNSKTLVDACFSEPSMESIITALQSSDDNQAAAIMALLAKKSPTSLKVTLKALQQGTSMEFDNCMIQEFRLCSRFLQGHDFIEGIRAVIIDKDQAPHWQPPTLAGVTSGEVEAYFSPMQEELMH